MFFFVKYRAPKCDIIIFHFSFFIQTLKPHRETETVAVRTCAKFKIASTTESEDREVWRFTKSHTNLSYLSLDPSHRIQHLIREFSISWALCPQLVQYVQDVLEYFVKTR